ncbi:TonB-dependent receptor domain-containing protein [Entomohabitans teleogrylli]|uniref:TonB-dependent receptor domain-containing protein n=1 Tax=Entomohabitans teleogrylli TaxID=1384589 RepID=UPI000AE46B35|nr:TonB-dependent receptor [Entomohabitans teleogrylli]
MKLNTITRRMRMGLMIPALGMAAPVMAEEITDSNEDVMVVTASAIEQRLKDAPASVSVITAAELEKNIGKSATDLADVLERVAGVSKAIGTDVSSGIQIRGMPAAYTLLLVDGKRVGSSNGIKSTQQNYFDDINWIPVETIERIEVVRGPMSALYGSDAMGGVVNIITKKNSDAWHGSLTAGTRQPQDSDRGDTNTWTGSIGGPLGYGFDLRMNGSWNKRNADKSDTSALRWGSGLEGKKVYSYGAELGWDINSNHRVSLSTQQGTEEGIQGSSVDGDTINLRGVSKLERENYAMDYRGIFDFGSAKLSAYQNKYKNAVKDVPLIANGVAIGNHDTKLWSRERIVEGDINLPFDLLLAQNLTLGGQWKKEELDNPRSLGVEANSPDTYGNHYAKATSKGVFIEDQITLVDDLTLTLGLRRDHTDYGNRTTPRAYLVWQATDYLTLKGGYSEGFKAPSVRQASTGFIESSRGAGCNGYAEYTGGGCYTMGNDNLKPEKSENWEIGAIFDYEGWGAGLTFFDSRFKDKIATAPIGYIPGDASGSFWLERVNLDSARTQGVEGNLTIPLIQEPMGPWMQRLSLSNNFTRMIKAEDSLGVMLVTTPKLATWSSLDWQVNKDVSMSLTAQYYGKMLGLNSKADQESRGNTATARIRNAYTIYGVSGQYKATKNLKFNVGVDNLFDKDPVSSEPSGSATSGNNYYVPGRTFYASMTASF